MWYFVFTMQGILCRTENLMSFGITLWFAAVKEWGRKLQMPDGIFIFYLMLISTPIWLESKSALPYKTLTMMVALQNSLRYAKLAFPVSILNDEDAVQNAFFFIAKLLSSYCSQCYLSSCWGWYQLEESAMWLICTLLPLALIFVVLIQSYSSLPFFLPPYINTSTCTYALW